ncbi:hypothetical protein [Spirosoma validum]|uniref:Uncharacterized protein n=1 Tax=Spirosoma validum TaxID=2771355 RepID=A0A927B8J0_9BACT|nr:hypothetical protein [Spirosoma validum]MBD2757233.1 hypothetical protein [Spirosoma validum]
MKNHYLFTVLSLSLTATAQTLPGMPYHPSPKQPFGQYIFWETLIDNYRWQETMNSQGN